MMTKIVKFHYLCISYALCAYQKRKHKLKNNKNKRKSSKVTSAECKMPPSIVMELVELKIHELERMIVVFEDKVNDLKNQQAELVEFKERWQNGAKDGVHGKV